MSLVTIPQAVAELRQDGIVALPSETVYGLAARIDSEPALKKIFSTKQRPFFDPLIVHVENVNQAKMLCAEWPEIFSALTEQFWPGPLTLIAKKRPAVSNTITAGLPTVAVRCPQHPIFQEVLQQLGTPLAAPSANRFGHTSPTSAAHVEQEFAGQVMTVDGGACTIGVESTVVAAELLKGTWKVKILRPGGVARAQLNSFLTERGFGFAIEREASVASPGHLKEHYRPASPLVLLENKKWSAQTLAAVEKHLQKKILGAQEVHLANTPQEAARHLYGDLRKLSTDADHILWISRTSERRGEDWEAIWDRVERASVLIL
jgi:L-threonylcarbamoyladenylate synthase